MRNTTLSVRTLKLAAFVLLLVGAGVLVASCSGSKANVRREETASATGTAALVEVTTAAIKRGLPCFFA